MASTAANLSDILPPPSNITRPKFVEDKPNAVHQADILFLPHDKYKRKVYKYALKLLIWQRVLRLATVSDEEFK